MGELSGAAAAGGVGGGVRVVAKICAPGASDPAASTTKTGAAAAGSFRVAATRAGGHPRSPDAAALISFAAAGGATPSSSASSSQGGKTPTTRKEEHRLNWCYLQNETNHHVFLNEVKPLLRRLQGGSSCVVACGAAAATDQLFMVHVKSVEDFARLGCFDSNRQNEQPAKGSTQLHTRGHQGLIIHVSSFDQEGRECAVAKMHFLSLIGYVDPKQKSSGEAAALSSSSKSMYALMNVVQALNSNQSFVPYRQSKVTRILQDSLCKTSGAVVIACLDEISCEDTVSTLSLAARSSQVANKQYPRSMSVTSSKKANVNLSANANQCVST